MDRNILEYLPEFMREYREIKLICEVEQKILEEQWKNVETVWDNQFIDTADETTVKRWEKMLDISVGDTWTINDRKNKILTVIAEQRPYTDEVLDLRLKTIFGEGNYAIEYIAPLTLLISVSFDSRNEIANTTKLLERMLPANLKWTLDIFHNKYSLLERYTHEQLIVYTHEQLRDKYLFK